MKQNVETSNQSSQRTCFESIARARFYQFAKLHKRRLINFLYNERLRRILKMICVEAKKKPTTCVVLDIGCGSGYFSRVLSLRFTTIGFDVDRGLKSKIQKKHKKSVFLLADVRFMPFKNHSADIVVCTSVLEHLQDLENQIQKIEDVLKRDGVFLVGYPIETRLFKFIWKRISPLSFRYIDQSQTSFCNPLTDKQECYWEDPHTHKQDYQTIRNSLKKHFKVLQKEKLPFNIFPDSLAYYECVKMEKKDTERKFAPTITRAEILV